MVTISLLRDLDNSKQPQTTELPSLTDNDKKVLLALMPHNQLGVTDIHNETCLLYTSIC